eukprot:1419911-Rhodomonas_salina.4
MRLTATTVLTERWLPGSTTILGCRSEELGTAACEELMVCCRNSLIFHDQNVGTEGVLAVPAFVRRRCALPALGFDRPRQHSFD